MDQKSTELIISFYNDIEERLLEFTRFIPYNDNNKNIVLPLLSGIIVEAGSLIDIIFREEYINPAKPKEELNITDYAPHYENEYKFSSIKTLPFIYPPSYIKPFESWIDSSGNYNPLLWWQNYNKLKHQRIEYQNLSTLEYALQTICALHQIISQLPTFIDSLFRNNMVEFGSLDIDYIRKRLIEIDNDYTVSIESKLFVTPLGFERFPDNPTNIIPHEFGQSKRLSLFLGRLF